jgi:hypothetical protein
LLSGALEPEADEPIVEPVIEPKPEPEPEPEAPPPIPEKPRPTDEQLLAKEKTYGELWPDEWGLLDQFGLIERHYDRPNAGAEYQDFLNRVARETGTSRNTKGHVEAARQELLALGFREVLTGGEG